MPTTERVFQIFKELNQIPRPSHHEERVADYLCQFAERLHFLYGVSTPLSSITSFIAS